jgi:A/G-specific adenine glycosylase
MEKTFTKVLMDWHRTSNRRQMPWKGEKDPYRIWLSEIILQQTRVEQGLSYYERFLTYYPTVKALADAPDTQVFKCWEGLGYYARCRNLLATARFIRDHYGGVFPSTYDEILRLKGIGPYTAAAISSFAFSLPHAVVDGNVTRVLARVFGISEPIDGSSGKKLFAELAGRLLETSSPGTYNQAIMDFGATICKPLAPVCEECMMKGFCKAFAGGMVSELPVKTPKGKRRKRWFYYIHAEHKGKLLMRERSGKDIWRHLHEMVLTESMYALSAAEICKLPALLDLTGGRPADASDISRAFSQVLTHQEIHGQFIRIELPGRVSTPEGYRWISKGELQNTPVPRLIHAYLTETGTTGTGAEN